MLHPQVIPHWKGYVVLNEKMTLCKSPTGICERKLVFYKLDFCKVSQMIPIKYFHIMHVILGHTVHLVEMKRAVQTMLDDHGAVAGALQFSLSAALRPRSTMGLGLTLGSELFRFLSGSCFATCAVLIGSCFASCGVLIGSCFAGCGVWNRKYIMQCQSSSKANKITCKEHAQERRSGLVKKCDLLCLLHFTCLYFRK